MLGSPTINNNINNISYKYKEQRDYLADTPVYYQIDHIAISKQSRPWSGSSKELSDLNPLCLQKR